MNSLESLIEKGLYTKGHPLKLNLGCGQSKFQDYINIDFSSDKHNIMTTNPDLEANILHDLIFPENSVDEIRNHHVLEHFQRTLAIAQLIKWHYWLKVDGVLHIEVPDFQESVKQFVAEDTDYKQKMAIVRHLEGDQACQWARHLQQWWDERFENTLSKLGFHITQFYTGTWKRWPYLKNIIVNAIKIRNVTIKEQFENGCLLLKDSMVSEGEAKTYEIWEQQLRNNLKEYL